MPKTPIHREYTARLDYDYVKGYEPSYKTKTAIEKVSDFAYSVTRTNDEVFVNNSTGGPAWNAYLEFRSTDRKALVKVLSKVERYLERFKCLRMLS